MCYETGPSDNMPPPPLRLSHWIWPNGSIFRPTSMTAIPLTRWSRFPRISGCPLVPRLSMGHILNTKAVGRMYAQRLGRKYEELNLIMVHLGGGH